MKLEMEFNEIERNVLEVEVGDIELLFYDVSRVCLIKIIENNVFSIFVCDCIVCNLLNLLK